MKSELKVLLGKLNFALGRNPRIDRSGPLSPREYIPEPFKAVLIVCADFELAWAWRFAKGLEDSRAGMLERARTERSNIPKIVELCEEHGIPITWATVGHLFLDRCHRNGGTAHGDLDRIPYHENAYWKYDRGDWYDDDPGTDRHRSPEWYAPDLIRMILAARTKHELACHTFSHIDCRDGVCTPEVLTREVLACQKVARDHGVRLHTFVHPGHTIGHLKRLRELGFTAYRTDYYNALGYPRKDESGLWELKSTMEFVYRKGWSQAHHVYRYTEIVKRAVAHHRVCIFWFHPSMPGCFVRDIMPRVFGYFDSVRQTAWITTVGDYVSWLNREADALR